MKKNKNFILDKDEFKQGKSSEQGRRQSGGGGGGGGGCTMKLVYSVASVNIWSLCSTLLGSFIQNLTDRNGAKLYRVCFKS